MIPRLLFFFLSIDYFFKITYFFFILESCQTQYCNSENGKKEIHMQMNSLNAVSDIHTKI